MAFPELKFPVVRFGKQAVISLPESSLLIQQLGLPRFFVNVVLIASRTAASAGTVSPTWNFAATVCPSL